MGDIEVTYDTKKEIFATTVSEPVTLPVTMDDRQPTGDYGQIIYKFFSEFDEEGYNYFLPEPIEDEYIMGGMIAKVPYKRAKIINKLLDPIYDIEYMTECYPIRKRSVVISITLFSGATKGKAKAKAEKTAEQIAQRKIALKRRGIIATDELLVADYVLIEDGDGVLFAMGDDAYGAVSYDEGFLWFRIPDDDLTGATIVMDYYSWIVAIPAPFAQLAIAKGCYQTSVQKLNKNGLLENGFYSGFYGINHPCGILSRADGVAPFNDWGNLTTAEVPVPYYVTGNFRANKICPDITTDNFAIDELMTQTQIIITKADA